LCFAGEADNQGSSQRQTGNNLSGLGDYFFYFRAVDFTVHGLENIVIDVLNRQINIVTNFISRRDNLHCIFGDVCRVGVKKANPLDSFNLLHIF